MPCTGCFRFGHLLFVFVVRLRRPAGSRQALRRQVDGRLPTLAPMIVVLMGVAGAGKSTVGSLVASRLRVPFLDADDFHHQSDVDAMRAGIALDDRQRQPWLVRLNQVLRAREQSGAVLACSALKQSYRETLRAGLDAIVFVVLAVSESTLADRLDTRVGHYAGSALLPSQLANLEIGDDVVAVNGELPPGDVADEVVRIVGQRPGPMQR
jgi:carbohydrate kinase (thermoresistant glucokinase family)